MQTRTEVIAVQSTDIGSAHRVFFVYGDFGDAPEKVRKAIKLAKHTVLGLSTAGHYDYATNSIVGGEKLEPVVEAWTPSRKR